VPLLICALLVAALPYAQQERDGKGATPTPILPTLKRTEVQLAIAASACGYGMMSLVMTATPISMHVLDGFSVETTAEVIRAHMLAMFIPSLFSGLLIARLGIMRALILGTALEATTIVFALIGQAEWHYLAGLIALGAGWNFMFVGGTTLLAQSVTGAHKYRVQGFSEMLMFVTMAIGSLAAGPLLSQLGWIQTNLWAGILPAIVLVALLRGRRSAPAVA